MAGWMEPEEVFLHTADKASRGTTAGIRFPLKIKFRLRVKCAKLPDAPVSG